MGLAALCVGVRIHILILCISVGTPWLVMSIRERGEEREDVGPLNTADRTETVLGHSAGELLLNEFRLIRHLPAMSDSLAEIEGGGQNKPPLPFPSDTYTYTNPRFLGAGSFGISWLVKGEREGTPYYGQTIVMKLLYVTNKLGMASHHLTWNEAVHNKKLLGKLQESLLEFSSCRKITDAALTFVGHIGAQRVMKCLAHNIQEESGDSPLYLLLEHAGDDELGTYVRKKYAAGQLQLSLVQTLTKQLFEALQFLALAGWIHHDLKPENIVVKEAQGTVFLRLIDFGASVHVSRGNKAETAATWTYVPYEWLRENFKVCDGVQGKDMCPHAFDVFSAGMTVLWMLCGRTVASAFPPASTYLVNKNYETYFTLLDNLAKKIKTTMVPGGLFTTMQNNRNCWGSLASTLVADNAAASFRETLRRTILKDAQQRPTAGDVLNTGWLTDVQTPSATDSEDLGDLVAPVNESHVAQVEEQVEAAMSKLTEAEEVHENLGNMDSQKLAARPAEQVGPKLVSPIVQNRNNKTCPEEFGMCVKCEIAKTTRGGRRMKNGRKQMLCYSRDATRPYGFYCEEQLRKKNFHVYMCAEPE